VFDIGDFVEIAAEVKNEQRDGIVTRGAEDGIGVGGGGADERKIDNGSNQLREAAADGSVVIDMDKLRMELITGEPAGFFLGKRFGVGAVDSGIDFLELCDHIINREPGEIYHLGSSPGFLERTYRQVRRSLETRFYFPANFINNLILKSFHLTKAVPVHRDR